MDYTCIGKMDDRTPVLYNGWPEYGIVPLVDDIVVVKGLVKRKAENQFRTLGTVKEWRKELRKHYSVDEVKEWLN